MNTKNRKKSVKNYMNGGDTFKLEVYCVDHNKEFEKFKDPNNEIYQCHNQPPEPPEPEESTNNDILFLGDSWTAGYYNKKPTDYYARSVMNNLSEGLYKYAYYPNGGAFGYTSSDLLEFIRRDSNNSKNLKDIIRKVSIVVLFIGINDNNKYDIKTTDTNIDSIINEIREINPNIKFLILRNRILFPVSYNSMPYNSIGISGYTKYGFIIARQIINLNTSSKHRMDYQLDRLEPYDLTNDNIHLTNHGIQETGKRVIIQTQIQGGNNNNYEKFKKKEVLGSDRVIFRKKNSKSKKEYIKYKKEFILLKDYIKLKSK